MYRPLLISFWLLSVVHLAQGQDFIANTRHIGLPDGISHQHVQCFHQDARGLVWIGTHYGLNRFDGHNFVSWTVMKDSLANNNINFLLEDKAGWIWAISTEKWYREEGVTDISLVHSVTGEVQIFTKKIEQAAPFQLADIVHFFGSPDRSLFFSAKNGFWKYEPDSGFEPLALPDQVKPLQSFDGETFWGTGEGGLVHFDARGKVLQKRPFLLNDKPKRLFGNGTGCWLGEVARPLVFFPSEKAAPVVADMDFTTGDRKPCFFDAKRNWAWVGNLDNLVAFDSAGHLVFDLGNTAGLPHKGHITSLFVDQQGLVWLGSRYGLDLLEVKPDHFKRYLFTPPEDSEAKPFECRGILEKDGQLFVNTYKGSVKIDLANGHAEPLDRPSVFAFSSLHYVFHEAADGTIWSASNHLSKMDGHTGHILESIEVPGDGYKNWAMHVDRTGTVWLNKGEGLFMYKNDRLSAFHAYNGFSALEKSQVYAYHESKSGNIWLGTDSGLYVLDLQQGITDRFWSGSKNGHYLPGGQIQHIHEDAEGYFWMATEHEGLIRWHPETREIRHFTRADGLPTNTIYCVYEDERGYLWLSTDFGIVQMDKQARRKKIYMPEDGVSHHEFNRTSHHQTADGRLYFGSQNGVTAFHPKDFWADWDGKNMPRLEVYEHVEGRRFGRRLRQRKNIPAQGAKLELSHDVGFLDFKLISPNYFLANKTSYFYLVEPLGNMPNTPFPDDWVKSTDNVIKILGIIPGHYRLNIEARGLDGERLGRPLTHEISMRPPFDKTVWFRVLVIALLAGAVWAYIFLRTRRLKNRQLRLEQMVEERTQQILQDQAIIQHQEERIRYLDALLNEADEQWVRELDGVIREKLSNFNLNIADIADEMNISRTHFFRKIKTVTGLTPNQYLQEARLQEAKSLLDDRRYATVKAVSLSVGFRNPSYFSRLFKERFGTSPADYFNEN